MFLFGFILLTGKLYSGEKTLRLLPVEDAQVSDGKSSELNFGATETLFIRTSDAGANSKAFMKFDIPEVNGAVVRSVFYLTLVKQPYTLKATEAILRLWNIPKVPNPQMPGYDTHSWIEGAEKGKVAPFEHANVIIWNNSPALPEKLDVSVKISSEAKPGDKIMLDVTQIVQTLTSSGEKTLVVCLASGRYAHSFHLGSKEHGNPEYRPILEIIYKNDPEKK